MDDEAELIRCVDGDGTGFVITAQEARMQTKGKSSLSMKMASGEVYEVMFVSFPKSASGSSEYEKLNTEMVYLYINGIMSGFYNLFVFGIGCFRIFAFACLLPCFIIYCFFTVLE